MRHRPHLPTIFVAAWLASAAVTIRPGLAGEEAPAPTPEQVRFFETQVRPTLAEHCFKCHGPDKQKANLRLDSRAGALAGGDSGPAVVPGNLEESLLITAIGHADELLKMPPAKKLDEPKIAALTQWVKIGAPWPGADPAAPAVATRKGEYQISEKDRAHWAFRPIVSPAPPAVQDKGWGTNPIDAFIRARLAAKGLRPNPPATGQELIRRAYF
ncbi:MAG: hypothetical protein QOE66_1353, partial [Chloroflexota bacterium]|nr:hypothetical protein [Chloroflexota bacterium]